MNSSSSSELVVVGIDRVGDRLRAVPDDGWSGPTQSGDWVVRDVVNHLVAAQLSAPHILAGETADDIGDRYDGDVLGQDVLGAWDDAVTRSRTAWQDADPTSIVHTPFGKNSVNDYAEQTLFDLTVREWDLGHGIGRDDPLSAEAVTHALAYARLHIEELHLFGVSEPIPTTSDDETVQLLALVGRVV